MVESPAGNRFVGEFESLDDRTMAIIRTDVRKRLPTSNVLNVWIWVDASRGSGGWERIYTSEDTEPGR
jgi:hypothetical protein